MNFSNLLEFLTSLKPWLPWAQIVVALVLTVLVLLQPRGEALGSAFGQSFMTLGKLRGFSKKIFYFTLALGLLFILLALLGLLV